MSEHFAGINCWCSPKVENIDSTMLIIHHDVEEGDIAGRLRWYEAWADDNGEGARWSNVYPG